MAIPTMAPEPSPILLLEASPVCDGIGAKDDGSGGPIVPDVTGAGPFNPNEGLSITSFVDLDVSWNL